MSTSNKVLFNNMGLFGSISRVGPSISFVKP